MQFDNIINKILREELSDREKRIEALKHIVPSEAPGTLTYDVKRLKDFNLTQFPRVTWEGLIEENWGTYSIVFQDFDILFEVQYNCGKIEVYNYEDAEIEDWEVVNIFANLRPIAGENYYVILDKNTVPNLYQYLEERARDLVIEDHENPNPFRQPSFT